MNEVINVPEKDRQILRELAKQVAEIGNLPIQKQRAELWTRHNDLDSPRPMVLVFPEGAWREMLPGSVMKTESKDAMSVELDLRLKIYYHEHMRWDDNVIEPVLAVEAVSRNSGWGIEEHQTRPDQGTGCSHFDPVIKTEGDIEKIQVPRLEFDKEATAKKVATWQEILGDILTIERRAYPHHVFCGMDQFAKWRGLDQILLDLIDRPGWVHQVMERMLKGQLAMHEAAMASGLVRLYNRNQYAGSGGTCYTRQLPKTGFDGKHVRSCDLWGFSTTQMFSEVSPAMHEEFSLQYERRFQERFGLNCYGCCEPLHNKLDMVKSIPNMRRISISTWANLQKCAEGLGNRYIFSWKPNPAIVAGEKWNPDAVRQITREAMDKTKGCVLEIILKDTHTCRNEPHRMWEWGNVVKEVIAERFSI